MRAEAPHYFRSDGYECYGLSGAIAGAAAERERGGAFPLPAKTGRGDGVGHGGR